MVIYLKRSEKHTADDGKRKYHARTWNTVCALLNYSTSLDDIHRTTEVGIM
jgi:hypothetical protein